MSSFIVDYKVIDEILTVRVDTNILNKYPYLKSEFLRVLDTDSDMEIYDSLERLGVEFLTLNVNAVNENYPDHEPTSLDYATAYKFNDLDHVTIFQAIKSLQCLMYQSCDITDYKNNPTYQKMETLYKILLDISLYLNPEYQDATWGSSYMVA